MDQAIRIDNRIVERRQEQQYVSRPFRRNPPPSHFVPRTNTNQYSSRDYNLPATCPKSNSRFGSQRHVQAIEMEESNVEMSGNDLGRL
ncbi:hypothetical protein BASA83_010532 [Batrachochytrium salamandrivorans]|nr:hypothetical protein BASA83_010532 [Batrachochytrium salamandrivorans]